MPTIFPSINSWPKNFRNIKKLIVIKKKTSKNALTNDFERNLAIFILKWKR